MAGRINPQIALSTTLPEVRSPLQTIGAIAQLREAEELNEQRRLGNEQKRRALEDDYAIRATLQKVQNPDAAIEELYKSGRATAAGALAKSVFEQRKVAGENMKRDLENTEKRLQLAAQIAQSITDEASFQGGRKAIGALLGEEASNALGEVYDPARIKQAVTWGTTRQQQIDIEKNAVDNMFKSWDYMLKAATEGRLSREAQIKVEEHYTDSSANFLSLATSQEDWDRRQRMLAEGGVPPTILGRFGNEWSPAAVANAKKIGMTLKEQADVANQQATRAETARHNRATEETARIRANNTGSGGGGGGRGGLTQNRQSEISQWKATQYRNLEKRIQDEFGGKIPANQAASIAAEKVRIENDARSMAGQPPLFDAELALSKDPAKSEELKKIRGVIRALTGAKATPLEQMQALLRKAQTERDPVKVAEYQEELKALREQYAAVSGR